MRIVRSIIALSSAEGVAKQKSANSLAMPLTVQKMASYGIQNMVLMVTVDSASGNCFQCRVLTHTVKSIQNCMHLVSSYVTLLLKS